MYMYTSQSGKFVNLKFVPFVDHCDIWLLSFSFDHCIVCPSSIYGIWLPLWYLQTFHKTDLASFRCS